MLAGGLKLTALDLDLPEEPRILDGQGGVGGKGAQELHYLRRELARPLTADPQGADDALLQEQRHGQNRAVPGLEEWPAHRVHEHTLNGNVGNLDRTTQRGGATRHSLA